MSNDVGYLAPATVEEALSQLESFGTEATLVSGGQDVMPLMNQGLWTPHIIIDLKSLRNLSGIEKRDGAIAIGALTTHREIQRSELLLAENGLLIEAANQIGGGVQVRNRGTIGGAVCAANPAYDYAACLVAVDAEIEARSLKQNRRIKVADFFQDANVSTLRPNELVTQIKLSALGPNTGFSYHKLKFSDGCYCIASAACAVQVNENGTVRMVRLALGGVSSIPVRLSSFEDVAIGSNLSEELLAKLSTLAQESVTRPISDIQADGEYRRAMAGVVAVRALSEAFEKARKSTR